MKLKPTVALLALAFTTISTAQVASPAELKMSSHLTQIKAPAAWSSTTGGGVVVGVIDSGITITNSEFKNKVVMAPKTNFIAGASSDVRDLNGHGTHVAGIIAAAANGSGVVGAAPGAAILPVRVASAGGLVSASALGQGIRRASELVPIANISIGGGACCISDVKYAVDRGLLMIVAAGNNGQPNPVWPARYAKEAWAKGRIIAVGAVDQRNNITSWSNRAGDTKDFYLVAPATWILSTKGDGLAYMSGTSMAAPMVTGAAALVKSRWAFLNAEQIAEVLFRSATDLGAPGTDPIYGRGLLNIEQAMKPTGITYVVTASRQIVAKNSIKINPAAAYATAVKASSVQSAELDEFGRDFEFNLSDSVVAPHDQTLSRLLAQSFEQASNTLNATAETLRLNFSDGNVSVGVLGSGLQFMQLDSANESVKLAASELTSPAINLVPSHNHVGFARNAGNGLKIKAAAFTTAGSDQLVTHASRTAKSHATAVSFVQVNPRSSLGLTVAAVNESSSFLGGTASGLNLKGAPNLTFITAEAVAQLSNNTIAFAQYTQAKSARGSNRVGLAATVDQAQAIKLGVIRSSVFKHKDRLNITVEQPLRVTAGKLTVNLLSARDEQGNLIFENKTVNLAARGQETQIKFDYMVPLKKQTQARAFVQFNNNPAHDAAAKTQSVFGLQLFMTF